jgi:hypothetical protein
MRDAAPPPGSHFHWILINAWILAILIAFIVARAGASAGLRHKLGF